MNSKKIIHLEVIRILALFCIVYNHIGYTLFVYTENTLKFTVSLVLSILCKIGVPLFFMISGALLLGREESWADVYKKRVLRIVAVIVLFTVIRFFYECYVTKTISFSLMQLIKAILTGNLLHPYWFLYTYLSVLLLLPILRLIIKNLDEQGKKYFLMLILVFDMIIPLKALVINQDWQFSLLLDENICYLFLGYFIEHGLDKRHFTLKNKIIALSGAVIAVVISFWMVVRPYINGGEFATAMIPVLSMPLACALFYLIRGASFRVRHENNIFSKLILQIGGCVFGVYLIEDYLRAFMVLLYGQYDLHIDNLERSLFSTLLVVIIGIPIAYIMKRIPILNKLL